jgi:molybdenum cofactor cytidylyltransferase
VIAAIVLAAGRSSRMGRPKQLLELDGVTVLQHVLDTAAPEVDEIIVVLGHEADAIGSSLLLPGGARVVVNPYYRSGQASSLQAGLRALGPETQAAVILLGDQPGVATDAVRAVIDAYDRTGGPMVQVWYRGRPGHPVLLDRGVWPEVEAIQGDLGARNLLADRPDRVVAVEMPGDPPPDLDTWEDYRRIAGEHSRYSTGGGSA